jgi:TctA family transporter
MEILDNLLTGGLIALSWQNLAYCFLGVLLGTLVGVLPGISPVATISMLLPVTYAVGSPITSIIFMAGIYYGSQYGGSTTAILLRLPGEPASLVTCLDGYAMTKNGRAGAALAIAALASFFAGTVMTVMIALIASPIASLAFEFGPAEYTSLMLLGLLAAISLTNGDFLKGLGMTLIGILLATVGTDLNSGVQRFTFESLSLADGIKFAIIAIGTFGIGEIVYNLLHTPKSKLNVIKIKDLYPTKNEFKQSIIPILRGTTVGGILGLLPGTGPLLASMTSYALEKTIAKNSKEFGNGKIAGLAGPEAANNAGAQASFIPMLSLGLPSSPVMALMLATLMIHGIQPGPQIITSNPDLFWGLIISMLVGNFLLVILNLPLIGIWVTILRIPPALLLLVILIGCVYGVYSIDNNWISVWLLIPFSIFGYVCKILDLEPTPLAMGFIVGLMFEEYLRRSLTISEGDWMFFLSQPISAGFIGIAVILVVSSTVFKLRKR